MEIESVIENIIANQIIYWIISKASQWNELLQSKSFN